LPFLWNGPTIKAHAFTCAIGNMPLYFSTNAFGNYHNLYNKLRQRAKKRLTMRKNDVISDQFNKWSDIYEKQTHQHSSAKTKNTFAQTAKAGSHFERLFNRALQALWQTGVQMCSWPGPWAKVLFIRQQAGQQTTNGLRSTRFKGKGRTIPGKLPQDKVDFRGALRHQPRAFASQAKVLARSPPQLRGRCNGNDSDRC